MSATAPNGTLNPQIPPVSIDVSTLTLTLAETKTVFSTVTQIFTVTPTLSTSTQFHTPSVTWEAPSTYTDLSSFSVQRPPSSHRNLDIVVGIPKSATDTAHLPGHTGKSNWANDTSVLKVRFPKGSINPGNKDAPKGGFQFYAVPLPNVSGSQIAELEYSVFFPQDFAWQKGGKLPGLYGGHTGCSGGNAALDCFSTRLMWRAKGVGELYLYVPRDKQAPSLCLDPQSVCDAKYGLSIGRGSFTWTLGAWTYTKQTVRMNTPGRPDGQFTLQINQEIVIHRTDIYYRSKLDEDENNGENDGGLLGDLLGLNVPAYSPMISTNDGYDPFWGITPEQATSNTSHGLLWPLFGYLQDQSASTGKIKTNVTLTGIFFSTFFGGHDESWASPKDQEIWFKDFALAY